MTLFSRAVACGCLLGALMANQSLAQVPTQLPSGMTPEQAMQLLRQNPQLAAQLRQRLLQSGLTPDQIRAQLAANGYPPNMLDAYLGNAPMVGGAQPGAEELSAFEALGISIDQGLRVDTGAIFARAPAVAPESLAAGNYVFGVDVFGRTTTQFLPVLTGPVSPDYRVGPGDRLVVILTGDVERSHTLLVSREGFLLVPLVGQVFVSNLTVQQVTDVLYSRLQRVYSKLGRDAASTTHLDVVVASVRVNQVSVIGEVNQPGAYQMSALGTALTALYIAGGVTQRADMRRIEIRRLDSLVATLDLYDYLLRGSTRGNVRLEAGDVVFVPLHGTRVQITGAVLRPAIYELAEGETLPDLLRAAGGFHATAALDRLTIHRVLPAAERTRGAVFRTAIDVPLAVAAADPPTTTTTGGTRHSSAAADDVIAGMVIPTLRLEDGDSVAVDSVPPLSSQLYVEIAGMVNKAGRYPWRQGMTLRDLIMLARGPQLGAYLTNVEIARLPADRSRAQLADTIRAPIDSTYLFEQSQVGRYVGPPGPAFTGSGAPEVLLQPFDNVLVLKQPDFELQRTVQVRGEVRFPGTYSLRSKNERLMDLLDRAGGLSAQAYPNGIRFYRSEDSSGRVAIDLGKVLKNRNDKDNIILTAGDSLFIPAYQPIVRVEGSVNSPRSVTYVSGEGLDYYLNAAGGVAYQGDKKRVFVQQPNGHVRAVHKRGFLLGTSKPIPEPGAVVTVPAKDTTRTDRGASMAEITQLVVALTTIVALIVTRPR